MDLCESDQAIERHTTVETPRPPLVPAERNNAASTIRRPRTREVSSRYKSPSPTPTIRRCSSPNHTRTASAPSQLAPKRAQSAERKRPSTPTSPSRPTTPVHDSSVDTSRKVSTGRLVEGLWPSTMRSLSVSFQSDIISIPVTKKEKSVSSSTSDRTLRPASNGAHKQSETSTVARKPAPERKRSPLKGKSSSDQSENSKPVGGINARLIDQHRWPSRTGGKVYSNASNSGMDISDKISKNPTSISGIGLSAIRRLPSSDGTVKPLQKSVSDAARQMSADGTDRGNMGRKSFDGDMLAGPDRFLLKSLTERLALLTPSNRSQPLPSPGSRQPSPSRTPVSSSTIARGVSPTPVSSSTISRGVSPSRTRPSTPPSRGISPSRMRPSTVSSQSNSSNSVLSFIVDFQKGKKSTGFIEDAHQLRLLYNRYLQWRFANAQAETVLHNQKVIAEQTLYNVWIAMIDLWDSVLTKRIILQQMQLELKLNSILNEQMISLDEWASLDGEHFRALSGAVEDLEASTLRLPVTGGARVDTESLKGALCSAVDMMHATGSSMYPLLTMVEEMNHLVSDLAAVAARERSLLDQCEALLASTAALQVEEFSLRTHLLQSTQILGKRSTDFWQLRMPS